ncbi:gamma carbonic anhydrase family protein [Streptomyces pathocidini]|uniref:Gamma carbonic anhydrase family protein n=1 Tax=Streptomyces pathocidini TaxID=1650571 RepID=A0ABW7UPV9_9ACTN|nr:gamma carbonic anhydrase family protein [Streptomyces pathocidini]
MLLEHRGKTPVVPESAYVAPSAVLCGAVVLGERARVLPGAVLTAEDGEVRTGADVVVMENALVPGCAQHPGGARRQRPRRAARTCQRGGGGGRGLRGDRRLDLPRRRRWGERSELRINSVLHVNSNLPPGTVVPIGWIAAGDPARLFSPDRHGELWEEQRALDFPGTVYGVPRGTPMRTIMACQTEFYGAHLDDRVLDGEEEDGGPDPAR